jgi:hypothetical protein
VNPRDLPCGFTSKLIPTGNPLPCPEIIAALLPNSEARPHKVP